MLRKEKTQSKIPCALDLLLWKCIGSLLIALLAIWSRIKSIYLPGRTFSPLAILVDKILEEQFSGGAAVIF